MREDLGACLAQATLGHGANELRSVPAIDSAVFGFVGQELAQSAKLLMGKGHLADGGEVLGTGPAVVDVRGYRRGYPYLQSRVGEAGQEWFRLVAGDRRCNVLKMEFEKRSNRSISGPAGGLFGRVFFAEGGF
jgi:hypothetical protein